MKNRKLTMNLLIAFLSVVLSFNSIADQSPTTMVEVIELKAGKTSEDVQEYFKRVGSIIARYGAHNLHKISIPANEKNNNESVVFVWEVEDMSKLKQLFNDEEYSKNIPFRDSIFNLPDRQMFLGKNIK